MKRRDIYGKFYNPTKILSYNKVLNFSIGSRSIGKSTGFALFLLRDYIENGHQFIYCRRTKDELDKTCFNYFDNAVSILKSYGYEIGQFTYSGGEYMLDGVVCGYAIPLSLQQKYKSSNYSLVWWILYDEFMIDKASPNQRYLGGSGNAMAEVSAMVSLFQTVDRGIGRAFRNETRIIFIGNAGTFFNPFFINYGIDQYLRPDTKYLSPKNDLYVLEATDETEATKDIKESNGYLISPDRVRSYAYDNRYADLTDSDFIEKAPEGMHKSIFNFVYDNHVYGVYQYPMAGYIFISDKACDGRTSISLTTSDHRPNYLMIRNYHTHPYTKLLKDMYDKGLVRFKNYKCKLVVDFYLKYDV